MNVSKVNLGALLIETLNKSVRNYSMNQLPYTTELYQKNYIKYKVQSKQGVTHDYVFHGDERLPTLEERLKGNLIICTIASAFSVILNMYINIFIV
jgi:hypothetical protein